MKILVTGAEGFIGSNLVVRLRQLGPHEVVGIDRNNSDKELSGALQEADIIYHLAGVNRPTDPKDFTAFNADLTRDMIGKLVAGSRRPIFVLSSSIQAVHDTPYGESKRKAEEWVFDAARSGIPVAVYRLPNVFGKWCRPNYNSVVATFCYNAAHGLPLRVDDPGKMLEIVHVDDVVNEFSSYTDNPGKAGGEKVYRVVEPVYRKTVSELKETVLKAAASRLSGVMVDLGDSFVNRIQSVFLSYVDAPALKRTLEKKTDARGYLAEFIKSASAGQIFISTTKPGITRGNHCHNTKFEQFFVIKGRGLIRLRSISTGESHQFEVRGDECAVIDIPPGYAHAITNIGDEDLITVFWANEPFNPSAPDTYPSEA